MPIKKIVKKSSNDKFYTKPAIADMCVAHLKRFTEDNLTYVEPSAGRGSFSDIIACSAYDIAPEADYIRQLDWLSEDVPELQENWVMFGNPPFGRSNSLSKAFIKKGIDRGCTYIGFVLPNSFKKISTQKVFPEEWSLVGQIDLPKNSFLLNNEEYHVPCVFQVWTKAETAYQDMREKPSKGFTEDFTFVAKKDATCFMFGAAPTKIIPTENVTDKNRGYYLKTKKTTEEIQIMAKKINWVQYANSTVNGGVAWFSKDEIVKIWEKEYEH